METMMEPVLAVEPALADRAEPVARLTALFAALLNDRRSGRPRRSRRSGWRGRGRSRG